MSLSKRIAVTFLAAINLMNIFAGAIAQIKMLRGSDVTSIIPISAPLTVNQVLLANLACVMALMLLICIVTTYIATDVPYSPVEIISNIAGIFLIIPAVILILGIVNAVRADILADKIWIIVASVAHFIICAINVCCVLTVKEDAVE